MRASAFAIVMLAPLTVTAGRAVALPVFAHRYGLSCQACHTTVPHLNAFGEAFLKKGFRLPNARDGIVPVAVKVNLAYGSEAEDGLPKAVVDEVEVLTGGAIGPKFNYFFEQYVIDGGEPGRARDAWLQYNAGAAHVRAGQFTLPLPVDPETQRDTQAHYLAFDQRVGGNQFAFFDPRIGADAYVDRGDVSAHLAALQGGDAMLAIAKGLSRTTIYAYGYRGRESNRQGYGARYALQKLTLTGIVQRGSDANPEAGGRAASSASFLESRYAFSDSLAAVSRYDRACDALSGREQQTVLSLIVRPARNMRFTIEDRITDRHALTLAWLFAY